MKKNKIPWYAQIIFELRTSKGLTQMDLAFLAEVSQDSVFKIEKGYSTGQFVTVEKILLALDHELEIVPEDGKSSAFKR